MASFIFTLGFHEDFILRRLVSDKAQPGARIVVFTVKPAAGATKAAYQNLVAYTTRTGLRSPELVEINTESFPEMLAAAIEVIEDLEEPIIADLTGGMRILVIAVYTAIIMTRKRYRIYIAAEGDPARIIQIESTDIEALKRELPEEKKKLLQEIARNPGITITQLARLTGKSEKTIANHLTELKKLNLVITRGKTNNIIPTKMGILIVKIMRQKTTQTPEIIEENTEQKI